MSKIEDNYEELFIKYTLALRKLEAELNNLFDAYKFNNSTDMIDHTKSRIKSFESASKKLKKKNIEVTPENMENLLSDMVGFRIVCPFYNDVYKVVNLIKDSGVFNVIKENDYIENPKESGYSSYHIDVSIPIRFGGNIEFVNAEIQVRTMAMDLWATLDHRLRYKLSSDIQDELSSEFIARANDINRFDLRMQYLQDEVIEMKDIENKEKEKIKIR